MSDVIQQLTAQLIGGKSLSYQQMSEAMLAIMQGQSSDIQNAGFLAALATKGETVTELLAGAEVMRSLSTKVSSAKSENLVDPVGTGGTYSNVFNVSTASSITASCLGVEIAKHGGRSASSKSGSADFLEAVGVNIMLSPEQMQQCIEQFGIGFMFAPSLHSAMKHVAPVRKAMGIRTIFNLLGPMTNPSGAKNQVLGVFDQQWISPLAQVCQKLGQNNVMVISSDDGIDEISIAAPTQIQWLKNQTITQSTFDPKDYNIYHDNLDGVRVQNVEQSIDLIVSAFKGQKGPAYDMISLNAAAILLVANKASDWADAIAKVKNVLDSQRAYQKLQDYITFTNQWG